jgi:hypothetical protein
METQQKNKMEEHNLNYKRINDEIDRQRAIVNYAIGELMAFDKFAVPFVVYKSSVNEFIDIRDLEHAISESTPYPIDGQVEIKKALPSATFQAYKHRWQLMNMLLQRHGTAYDLPDLFIELNPIFLTPCLLPSRP